MILGSLSKGVFELLTSTGSDIFSILKYIDNTKIVFLSLFLIIEMICPKIWVKIQLKNEKSPLLVDVRHSKASLLIVSSLLTDTKLYN